jgi:protein-tyrosine phosphatase
MDLKTLLILFLIVLSYQNPINDLLIDESDDEYSERVGFFPFASKITDKIYLGSVLNAWDKWELQYDNVSHVLCCAKGLKAYFPDIFEYKLLDLDDIPSEDIVRYFYDAIKFIDSATRNVFVHCKVGKSRSASNVIAYLMYNEKKRYDEVLKYVRKHRWIAYPNSGFREQLKNLDVYFLKSNYDLEGLKGMTRKSLEEWVKTH